MVKSSTINNSTKVVLEIMNIIDEKIEVSREKGNLITLEKLIQILSPSWENKKLTRTIVKTAVLLKFETELHVLHGKFLIHTKEGKQVFQESISGIKIIEKKSNDE